MMIGSEFYSFPHVVAIGRRKMVPVPDNSGKGKPKDWEVYVRLVSGSSFSLASGLSYSKSRKAMLGFASDMNESSGSPFVTTPEACVPFFHVARVFVDGQENEFVTVMEDSSSATYILEKGSQQKCEHALQMVAGAILQAMNGGEPA